MARNALAVSIGRHQERGAARRVQRVGTLKNANGVAKETNPVNGADFHTEEVPHPRIFDGLRINGTWAGTALIDMPAQQGSFFEPYCKLKPGASS